MSRMLLRVACFVGLFCLLAFPARAAADRRSFGAGEVVVKLNGKVIPAIDVSGGEPYAEVVVATIGSERVFKKSLGPVKYEPIVLTFHAPLDAEIAQWIGDLTGAGGTRRSGSVLMLDQNFAAKQEMKFTDALISQVVFPAADAGAKEAAKVVLTIVPERTERVAGDGQRITVPAGRQKGATGNSYKLELGKLSGQHVTKVSSLTLRVKVADSGATGRDRARLDSARVEVMEFQVVISAVGADSWTKWAEEFIVLGRNSQNDEVSGRLVFLDAAMKGELFAIELQNVGICRLAETDSGGEKARTYTATLYAEGLKLVVDGKSSPGEKPAPEEKPQPRPRPRPVG